MADRESLRDLQTRLAVRLQAAQSQGVNRSWLAVRVAGRPCLLPLEQAGEICEAAGIQAVPYVKAWFVGVVNVRGNLMGAVDIGKFLGWTDESAVVPEGSAMVTLNPQLEVNCGLMVDSLAGLRTADSFVAQEDAAPDAPTGLGRRHKDTQGMVWQELDLRALAQSHRFLSVGM